ncbi:MAG: Ribosome-recycling factor [Acetothermia bacterium 64_32]|nr:MAG: Ribosome-recycling factor [Acetothermia bacterium 64_32]MBC7097747.1 ribosome recycling factor [Candidatus Bipolaricaulota bacterium]HAF70220.1 ribosome recycling factor [Candidatus Acetothermia bacterium]
MEHELVKDAKAHMEKTLEVFKAELSKVHTGRANPALLEDVVVDYYGTPTPLKHLANIVAPDPDMIVVRPFDRSQIGAIERAIMAADLGLNPQNDGQIVRVKVPRLTEQRRNELVKLVRGKGEEAKVALRNIRREVREKLEAQKKEGAISEDDFFQLRERLDKLTQDYSSQVDELVKEKSEEMRTL